MQNEKIKKIEFNKRLICFSLKIIKLSDNTKKKEIFGQLLIN